MIDEILQILNRSPILSDWHVLQRDLAPGGEFILKARCRIRRRFTLQVRIKQDPAGVRYSYQFFSGATTILRWDNAPHLPGLDNFPHHFHNEKGSRESSPLAGNPLLDLPIVLEEVEKYLETQT